MFVSVFPNILQFEIGLCDRTQETFARKNNEKKNALASTHLICCEPGSQKYNAALKWKLPAVKHEWLLACAKQGQRVSEDPYLVGDSSCKTAKFCYTTSYLLLAGSWLIARLQDKIIM